MPCHPDRVRRHYISISVVTEPRYDISAVAVLSDIHIMNVARSPQAQSQAAAMLARDIYHRALAMYAVGGIRGR